MCASVAPIHLAVRQKDPTVCVCVRWLIDDTHTCCHAVCKHTATHQLNQNPIHHLSCTSVLQTISSVQSCINVCLWASVSVVHVSVLQSVFGLFHCKTYSYPVIYEVKCQMCAHMYTCSAAPVFMWVCGSCAVILHLRDCWRCYCCCQKVNWSHLVFDMC